MPARAKPLRPIARTGARTSTRTGARTGARTGPPTAPTAARTSTRTDARTGARTGPPTAPTAAPITALRPISLRPGARSEWRIGELTIVLRPTRAELRYARELVGYCRPTPGATAQAMQRAHRQLAARSRDPDELLPALAAAYAAVLDKRGARPGARVPLVELRDQLPGYTRAQFAWDLARLRRERRLTIGGRRLDLGVATGHAASQRSRVVWIENDGGGGSYFASFRLIPHKVSHEVSQEVDR